MSLSYHRLFLAAKRPEEGARGRTRRAAPVFLRCAVADVAIVVGIVAAELGEGQKTKDGSRRLSFVFTSGWRSWRYRPYGSTYSGFMVSLIFEPSSTLV